MALSSELVLSELEKEKIKGNSSKALDNFIASLINP